MLSNAALKNPFEGLLPIRPNKDEIELLKNFLAELLWEMRRLENTEEK